MMILLLNGMMNRSLRFHFIHETQFSGVNELKFVGRTTPILSGQVPKLALGLHTRDS